MVPHPSFSEITPVAAETRLVESHRRSVVSPTPSSATSGFGIDDAYYILFRHKWKLVLCLLAGLLAALGVFLYSKPVYQSHAKLFVRYVVMEGKAVRPSSEDTITKSPDMRGETIIASEMEILTSVDLARNVAQAVGPEKIVGKNYKGSEAAVAAGMIVKGLTVTAPRFSSVISLGFQHHDPEVTQLVLRQTIDQYLKMHLDVHRSAGMVGDFLAQETDQLRSRLGQTEEELRKARAKVGVISVDESKRAYASQIENIRQQIFTAQAEQAQRASILQQLTKAQSATTPAPSSAEVPADQSPSVPADDVVMEYRTLLGQSEYYRKREQELLTMYTPENARVAEIRTQLVDAETRRQQFEKDHPELLNLKKPTAVATTRAPIPASQRDYDFAFEAAQLNAIEARITALKGQMEILRKEAAAIDQVEGIIQELLRKKELEEGNYRRYAASLEQSRINDALGSGKVSNISVIQTPSPPFPDSKKTFKLVMAIAVGGLMLGFIWAGLIEFVFDRSVRRPKDVARMANIPLFLSIPARKAKTTSFLRRAIQRLKPAPDAAKATDVVLLTRDRGEVKLAAELYPHHEILRDRLIGYFESRSLTHKPKLVAVTGLGSGAGVTTTAAGLARCLSETGDGNVLLVDLTPGQGSAQQFHHGKASCGLEELLETRNNAQVDERLYVVADAAGTDKLSRLLPQRISKLVPKLKSSDFDYVIFDLPAVSAISITPRLAGLMDIVLVVVESEKNNRDAVQQATALLRESKAHVGAVLNKTRTYIPGWLHQDQFAGA